jgi:NADPH:quinone reductase-like Zn-dependent oxidoreductase
MSTTHHLPSTMKVAEYDRYGRADVIAIRERPVPTPGSGEVLVRVRAAALNPKDVLTRAGKFGLFAGRSFPKRMAYDFAGEAVALGDGVRDIAIGAPVFGMIQPWSAGACGQYVVVPATQMAPKPEALSFEEAAALPLAALTALQSLRDHGRLARGQRLFVNGASGGVGVYAVQLAKAFGAHVVAATSARNADFVRGLGADETLDYAVADLERLATPVDVYFDAFGNRSFGRVRASLTDRGTYVTTVPSGGAVFSHLATHFASQRGRLVVVRSNRADLELLASLFGEGRLRPVIEATYALDDVADAHRALESRRTRGKLVVRIP